MAGLAHFSLATTFVRALEAGQLCTELQIAAEHVGLSQKGGKPQTTKLGIEPRGESVFNTRGKPRG